MGKFKDQSNRAGRGMGIIKSKPFPDDSDAKFVTFSLKFYSTDNPKFRCDEQEGNYFRKLIERMKELSRERMLDLKGRRGDSALRFHRIRFGDARVTEKGFSIPQWGQYDDEAWQFALTSNEHGRVHGFIIGEVFYVVWLDPNHALYS